MGYSKSKPQKNKSQLKSKRLTGWLFIILGSLFFINALLIPNYSQIVIGNTDTPIAAVYPTNVKINKLNIKIPIQIGHYRQSEWDLTTDRAMYLYGSGTVGEKGNAVIYGHNNTEVFAQLPHSKVGDQIEITATNGKTLIYQIESTQTVHPNKVEVLQPTEDSQLTIFTCNGWFSETRFVVKAKLIVS